MLVEGAADTKPVSEKVFQFTSTGNANKDFSADVARQSNPLISWVCYWRLWAYQGLTN